MVLGGGRCPGAGVRVGWAVAAPVHTGPGRGLGLHVSLGRGQLGTGEEQTGNRWRRDWTESGPTGHSGLKDQSAAGGQASIKLQLRRARS